MRKARTHRDSVARLKGQPAAVAFNTWSHGLGAPPLPSAARMPAVQLVADPCAPTTATDALPVIMHRHPHVVVLADAAVGTRVQSLAV